MEAFYSADDSASWSALASLHAHTEETTKIQQTLDDFERKQGL